MEAIGGTADRRHNDRRRFAFGGADSSAGDGGGTREEVGEGRECDAVADADAGERPPSRLDPDSDSTSVGVFSPGATAPSIRWGCKDVGFGIGGVRGGTEAVGGTAERRHIDRRRFDLSAAEERGGLVGEMGQTVGV